MLLALVIALPGVATAATITVDNPVIGDGADGLCDLVEAIQNANNDDAANGDCAAGEGDPVIDVIELTVDVTLDEAFQDSAQTRGGVGLPTIATPMIIQSDTSSSPEGATARTILRDPASLDDFRHFFVASPGDLTLQDLVLTGGLIVNNPSPQVTVGGSIVNVGALTLSNTTVSGNSLSTSDYPNALPYAYGGGVFNIGDLTVTNSTISGNAVYAADSVLALTFGAGIASGGFNYGQHPTLVLSYSTVTGNVANSVGGQFAGAYGGGLYTRYSMDIVNSTVSGNTVQTYGTISSDAYGAGLEIAEGTATLTHSTVAANVKSESGAGVDSYAAGIDVFGAQAESSLYGTLVGHTTGENCAMTGLVDGGGNLADDATCDTIPDTLVGLDPVLADNGGLTRTHRTTSTTNARDNNGACGLPTDQRGVDRTIDGLCDTGSYEFFCGAPDEDVVLADDVLGIERTVEVCGMITGGPSYEIVDGGNLIARVGSRVVLDNGFGIASGGQMSVEIDPSIQMPDSMSPSRVTQQTRQVPITRPEQTRPATP